MREHVCPRDDDPDANFSLLVEQERAITNKAAFQPANRAINESAARCVIVVPTGGRIGDHVRSICSVFAIVADSRNGAHDPPILAADDFINAGSVG
jgi:aspartokinase-like uncharacterized kinase